MIHFPSDKVRQDLLRNPALIRITSASGIYGDEITLIIKAHSLTLKYVLIGAKLSVRIIPLPNNEICYYLQIADDDENPIRFWSGANEQSEIDLLRRLLDGEDAYASLFNETCTNIASARIAVEAIGSNTRHILGSGTPVSCPEQLLIPRINAILEKNEDDSSNRIDIKTNSHWEFNNVTYITNTLERSSINFQGTDEGDQQQELIRWLVDGLHPRGAYLSPQIHEPSGKKEFTDIFLSYDLGSFIIESKTLSIFSRSSIPGRSKLSRGIQKHVDDAIHRQLRIACRQLIEGIEIFDKISENKLNVNRQYLPHAICLIPDLSLIRGKGEYGGRIINEFFEKNNAYLHILDTTQLFRMVQAAQMLSSQSSAITPIRAFDAYLLERFGIAKTINEPDIDMVLDLVSDTPGISFLY